MEATESSLPLPNQSLPNLAGRREHRRRAFRFRLRTLFLFVTAFSLVCAAVIYRPTVLRWWQTRQLAGYAGYDLRLPGPRSAEAIQLLQALAPESRDAAPGFRNFTTWYIWKDPTSSDLLVLQIGYPTKVVGRHGRSMARILVLDHLGMIAKRFEFVSYCRHVGASFNLKAGKQSCLALLCDDYGYVIEGTAYYGRGLPTNVKEVYLFESRTLSFDHIEEMDGTVRSQEELRNTVHGKGN